MQTAVYWFRNDLRLDDQPALLRLSATGRPVVPVFVWAPGDEGDWAPGAASRVALHHALADLQAQLKRIGSRLVLAQTNKEGGAADLLRRICKAVKADALHFTPRFDPAGRAQEAALEMALAGTPTTLLRQAGPTLHEPWETRKPDGTPYRVFTPFYKNLLTKGPPAKPVAAPASLAAPAAWPASETLESLGLLPKIPWDGGFSALGPFTPAGAQAALARFTGPPLRRYPEARDIPGEHGTSRLSPHLAWGTQSIRRLWHAAHEAGGSAADPYLRQLVWRDFAQHLLYHFPHTPDRPLDAQFAGFAWRWPQSPAGRRDPQAEADFHVWQRGQTGYPLVDAGMRELWHTGWMHNRVRMVVGSLLVKHLRLHWLLGARWFWDTLVDADLANNTLGWQWIAGCGADAAPYFRVFNPVTQSEKFDPSGAYIRRWVPELAGLADAHLHAPWEAPPLALAAAGVTLGATYPRPVIGMAEGRAAALAAYAAMRG